MAKADNQKNDKAPAPETPQAGVVLSSPGADAAKRPGQPTVTHMPGGTTRTDY